MVETDSDDDPFTDDFNFGRRYHPMSKLDASSRCRGKTEKCGAGASTVRTVR